jgi:16S rRNA (uracil1498-N3)-methyltransferase
MKIHRFIGPFDLSKKELGIKEKEIVNQMKNVLRLKVGEQVELCDGKRISAIAEIKKISGDQVDVLIGKIEKNKNQTKNEVSLFCAVLKKENFELVVQKATECGVTKIIPIITARTIKTGLNQERLQKIAKEASEQSGRLTVPEISEPIKFEDVIKITGGESILFDASGELSFETHGYFSTEKFLVLAPSRSQGVSKDNSPSVNIFIGPEGGWTPEEIAMAKSFDFKIASLGPLVLRGETAAIVATYLISNLE